MCETLIVDAAGLADLDYDRLAAEWLRSLRGSRSQAAFSRRLRYRSNIAYLWESGRNWPTAARALWAAERTGVDVRGRLRGLFHTVPGWLDELDPASPEGVVYLMRELRGSTPVVEVAGRMGRSRFAVARWLKGTAQPRLPDFFRFIEAASLRLLDFIALFGDPSELEAARPRWAQLEAARRLSQQEPWSQAVFLALELHDYRALDTHRGGWIATRVGVSRETEETCLALLEQAGQIRRDDAGRWEVVRSQTVDTRRAGVSGAKLWWSEMAAKRIQEGAPGSFAYNVFSVSREDLERLKEMQRQYFRSVRSVVADSKPSECIAVMNLQLFEL
jgi:transcriptional regulator with XRE-family HTH domain